MKIDRRSLLGASTSLATVLMLHPAAALAKPGPGSAPGIAATGVRRRYVRVGIQNVFYLAAGEGPPVVMLHPSPGDSSYFLRDLAELAKNYAVFAFDSPGFGRSDPLPPEQRDVAYIADTIAAAMRKLGLPPATVYGAHTGAAVATELASRHPDVVRSVIDDGLAIFNAEESSWFADFFPPMVPDKQGGHFTSVWTRCRDQSIWFPWSYKKPDHLLAQGVAPATRTQIFMMGMMRCGRTYGPTFKSAAFYGPRVAAAQARIDCPVLFTCAQGDPLYSHLDRLPALKASQVIERAADGAAVRTLRDRWLATHAGTVRVGAIPNLPSSDSGVSGHVVELPDGQELFLRVAGSPALPPIVLLHDAPGSSLMHAPLISALSRYARVYAFDMPGCGESAALPVPSPTSADYARTISTAMKAMNIKLATVHGVGLGAAVALELAVTSPASVSHLVLHALPLPAAAERADLAQHYAPPIELKANGSHWYDTFLMLRDSLVFWPWYKNATAATQRHADPGDAFDADRMHEWTLEVMKQHHAYHHVIDAVWGQDTARLLGQVQGRVLVCSDARHRFEAYHPAVAASRPDLPVLAMVENAPAQAAMLAKALGMGKL